MEKSDKSEFAKPWVSRTRSSQDYFQKQHRGEAEAVGEKIGFRQLGTGLVAFDEGIHRVLRDFECVFCAEIRHFSSFLDKSGMRPPRVLQVRLVYPGRGVCS